MSSVLKIRRGTTAQHASFTGAAYEITVDTTKWAIVVHDGLTAGGIPMAKESATVAKTGALKSAVIPAGATGDRDGTPSAGYLRFNTSTGSFEGHNGTAWGAIGGGGGATGAGGDEVFMENDQVVTTDYTLTSGKNAISAGPITINSGVVVTVPSGAVWTIV